jgi:transcriptional regulator with XRE-family HTH domain
MKIGFSKWQRREDLPKEKAKQVNDLEETLRSIPQYRSKNAWTIAISKQHPGERGFSVQNLHHLALQWQRSGNDWRILVKYYTLWRDKKFLLRKHGLTPELVKIWLNEKGIHKKLAQQFGIDQSMVSLILHGESSGLEAEDLIREAARIIFGNKATARRELAKLLEEERRLQLNLEMLESRIHKLRSKLGEHPNQFINSEKVESPSPSV